MDCGISPLFIAMGLLRRSFQSLLAMTTWLKACLKKTLRILATLLPFYLSTFLPLYAFDVGTPAGSRGLFGSTTKYFFGDYFSTTANTSIWSSSETMNSQVLETAATTQLNNPLLYGTTSWFVDVDIIPGNTYYYWFESDYGSARLKEQSAGGYHTVYFDTSSALVIFDGVSYSTSAFSSLNLWHNWAGAPPAPTIIESARGLTEVNIKWSEPKISGIPALDMFGGGYEVWRSSYSADVSTSNAEFLHPQTPVLASYSGDYVSFTDRTIIANLSYYYSVRSYDAYQPSLYSEFCASTAPPSGLWYVSVLFKVDVSKKQDVKSVSIVSDFTDPVWKKMALSNNGDGTWGAKFSDGDAFVKQVWLVEGRSLSYKYVINDTLYEPDLPVNMGGPYRKATLLDSDRDGVFNITDVWAVSTLSEGADLPQEIVSFGITNTTYYADILWESFMVSTDAVSGYEILRSTVSRDAGYSVIVSTTALPVLTNSYRDYLNLGAGVTAYYKIVVVDSAGKKSGSSTPVIPGKEVPAPVTGLPMDAPASLPGSDTGIVYLDWSVPSEDPNNGPATYFIIRKSTYPLRDYPSWKKEVVVGKLKSHSVGDREYLNTLALGESCPGFYFTVGVVYSSWVAVGLSNPVLAVAPKIISGKSGGTITKGNYYLGSSTGDCKATLSIERNSVKSVNLTAVIKNYYELQAEPSIKTKIQEANTKAKSVTTMKFLSENELSQDGSLPDKGNTVFGFEIIDDAGNNYFSDRDGDGRADKFSARAMTIALPLPSDKNEDNLVDSTENDPEPVRISKLRVCRLNEKGNFWKVLEDIPLEIDKVRGVATVQVKELSIYALQGPGVWASDLSEVAVYPNPFKPYDG
ncbi:MAG: hypothetical protein AB1633_02655, partial [Elusimicrobiota bacterium]